MSPVLEPQFRERLVKLLGMLGSTHDGERAAAAAKADGLVRAYGMTWWDVVKPISARSSQPQRQGLWSDLPDERKIAAIRDNMDLLTPWERSFIINVANYSDRLSDKQAAILDKIFEKIEVQQ